MKDNNSKISITRHTTVREANHLLDIPPNLILTTFTLEQIVASAEKAPRTQTISVVDENGRLQGLIPLSQISDEVFFRVSPEEFLTDMHDLSDAKQYALICRLSEAATAAEMMSKPTYVKENETVVIAFHRMHEAKLQGLPIVDEQMVVIGYLDLLELVLVWLKAERRQENS